MMGMETVLEFCPDNLLGILVSSGVSSPPFLSWPAQLVGCKENFFPCIALSYLKLALYCPQPVIRLHRLHCPRKSGWLGAQESPEPGLRLQQWCLLSLRLLVDGLDQTLKKSQDLVGVHEGWRGRKVVIVGSVVVDVVVVVDSVVIDIVVVVDSVVVAPSVHHLLLPRYGKHKKEARAERQAKNR